MYHFNAIPSIAHSRIIIIYIYILIFMTSNNINNKVQSFKCGLIKLCYLNHGLGNVTSDCPDIVTD